MSDIWSSSARCRPNPALTLTKSNLRGTIGSFGRITSSCRRIRSSSLSVRAAPPPAALPARGGRCGPSSSGSVSLSSFSPWPRPPGPSQALPRGVCAEGSSVVRHFATQLQVDHRTPVHCASQEPCKPLVLPHSADAQTRLRWCSAGASAPGAPPPRRRRSRRRARSAPPPRAPWRAGCQRRRRVRGRPSPRWRRGRAARARWRAGRRARAPPARAATVRRTQLGHGAARQSLEHDWQSKQSAGPGANAPPRP